MLFRSEYKFRESTFGKEPANEDDKLYQFYDRNDIFETYLIEIISKNHFVIYSVKWRNQQVQ